MEAGKGTRLSTLSSRAFVILPLQNHTSAANISIWDIAPHATNFREQPPFWTSAYTIIASRLNQEEKINSTQGIAYDFSMPRLFRILLGDRLYPSQALTIGAPEMLTPAANDLTSPFLSQHFGVTCGSVFFNERAVPNTISFAGPSCRGGGSVQYCLQTARFSASQGASR